jgi:hypothetical protein
VTTKRPWYGEPRVTAKRLERLRKVADLWNKAGLGVRETARQLGVNPSTITKDRRLLIEMWRETITADVNEIAAREVVKLDAQEAELWLAWERSKRDKERTTQTEKRNAAAAGEQEIELGIHERTTTRVVEGRLPEARYMDLIIEVGKRRERLLGLDKGIIVDVGFDFRELVRAAAERRDGRRPMAEEAIERDADGTED